jgi:hypothetical protein
VSIGALRILVLGYIVRGPIGGMAWHHLQFVLGLARLGHDVFFLEDSDDYPSCYDPSTNAISVDPSYGLAFASRAFDQLGLSEKWAYYDAHKRHWHGPVATRLQDVCASADLLLNISGVNPIRDWLETVPVRVLVDTDPVFTQVRHLRDKRAREMAARHTAFFSFGENIGGSASAPDDGFAWRPTRQPIVLDCWPVTPGPKHGNFTTVMQWESYPPAQFEGRTFGTKSLSFANYLDLPRETSAKFELAIGAPPKDLALRGWRIRNPLEVSQDPWTYQSFIMRSKAEFSVAKHGYVVSQSGWFSERSACYLACGRPVLVQHTGFSAWLPTGQGVVTFSTREEASQGVQEIEASYDLHCVSAREIAEAYFDSAKVLGRLLVEAHREPPTTPSA